MSKSRSASPSAAASESLDAVRRRARHRLIGAAVLVLIGVVGFPLLFDTQPRPIAVDVPIDIPARQSSKPLTAQTKPDATATVKDSLDDREQVVASAPVADAPKPAEPEPAAAPVVAKPVTEAPPESRPEPKPEPRPDPKPAPAHEPKVTAEPKSAPRTAAAESARAQAALEGKSAERVVVQVGAYAESGRAQEVRHKLERAGFKTYTHVAKTAEGERIRVRIGPFDTRADAERAAAKVKALGLPTAVLTL